MRLIDNYVNTFSHKKGVQNPIRTATKCCRNASDTSLLDVKYVDIKSLGKTNLIIL